MDNTDNNGQQPTADDDELTKALDGINNVAPPTGASTTPSGLQFEESPIPAASSPAATTDDEEPAKTPAAMPEPEEEKASTVETPAFAPTVVASPTPSSSDLQSIKKDALEELRPLINKLDLPGDEKFDTLLLIIRSTDDQSLLSAAHDAAKSIEDENKRAQALLDVIKEVDFFAAQAK